MGTTIGAILVSYDIDRMHTGVKEEMKELGYFDNWHYKEEEAHEMPNTPLWHKTKSSDVAIRDIKNVCYKLGVRLEKAVAVLAREFAGI